jgi:hypothetical protein
MDGTQVLRDAFKSTHRVLEDTMNDVTPEHAHWAPPGVANPLGATYAHVVCGEDFMIHTLIQGEKPLAATAWAGKVGLSEMPPRPGPDYAAWTRSVRLDLPAFREYARAVYADTDAYLASLTDEGLDGPLDMSIFGMGQQTIGFFLSNVLIEHLNQHCGEIACLKGIQGVQGLPF